MKAIIVLVLLVFIILTVMLIVEMIKKAIKNHQEHSGKWQVTPRTSPENNGKTLWLSCAGEEDFLFWPTDGNSQWDWERAVMEAEIQCQEFNRLRKELSR